MVWFWLRSRQAEKVPSLIGNIAEIGKSAALADDIEKVAVIARRRVGPFSGGALAGFRSFQPDEQGAAGRIPHVADQPVAALAATAGEIMTAHRLGIARETLRQFGGIERHRYAAARSATRESG